MSLKRRISDDDLPESLAQMTIQPKRIMLEIDILPPIRLLKAEPLLPKLTLNPEHSQLILYKSISIHPQDSQSDSTQPEEVSEVQEMEWE